LESNDVVFSFRPGKRTEMTENDLKPDEAQVALDSIEEMQRAGFGRATPPRWFGIGLSLIVATGFALYAMEDPGNTPALFIVLGMVLFIGVSREKIGAFGKELPGTKTGMWVLAGICLFLLALFFGGIAIRRAYDLAWVPLVTGLIAGATIFLLGESERRYYRMRAAGSIRR
jgi:hypothetical protein